MRDNLPNIVWERECMVINHDSSNNEGTHWTCYVKENNLVFYFDSFGKLAPPLELIKYLGSECKVHYNSNRYQQFNTFICGNLCLNFLYSYFN